MSGPTPPSATAEVQGLCNYYARTGYYRHIQTVCNEFLKKRPNSDPTLVFWRAYGAMREGSINDAIRDLESVRRDGEMLFPVLIALEHAHKLSKIIDTDEVSRIQGQIAREQARVGERGLFQAAQFAWHADRPEDARDFVERLLAIKPASIQGHVLKCWIDLATSGPREFPPEEWDARGTARELEALMGKAKHYEALEQYPQALDNLNQAIVVYAWFLPALAEKAKVLMMMGDWDQAVDAAQRVLSQDPHNIEALRISVLFLLSQDAKYALAQQRISDLLSAIDRHEPKNAPLYESVSKPFARIAGRTPAVLKLCRELMDRACALQPWNAAYVVEKGHQHLLAGDYPAAVAAFRQAHKLDDSDMGAVLGQLRCQVYQGQLKEAAGQLEFIAEVQATLGMSPELAFVSALVAARLDGDKARAVQLLDQALELHMTQLRAQPYDVSYFVKLDPDFLVELAREYVDHVGTEPEVLEDGSVEAAAISKALKLLSIVRKQVPGLLDGQMLLARAKFLNQDFDGALHLLAQCARTDPSFAPASLLHAQILLRQEQPKAAAGVLEGALAHNFQIRDSLLFHIVRASSLAQDGELDEALQVLQGAMKLPGVREGGPPARGAAPSDHERCSVYLQLSEVLLRLDRTDEAAKTMHEAISAFSGTPQEGRITVANCEILLKKGDVEGALAILRGVRQGNPHFQKAKVMLANLYLRYRNDRRMYCACHEELARASPSVATFIALGEAYMNVQEPEKAIQAFESALAKSPKDASLASRIGKALVSTHDYVRAVDYYDAAIESDASKASLKYELAELYLRLKKYDLAQDVLEAVLEGAGEITGSGAPGPGPAKGERHTQELVKDVQAWIMLARVLKAKGMVKPAVQAYRKARATQLEVVNQTHAEAPDTLAGAKHELSTICTHLAQFHVIQKDYDAALALYHEALKHEPKSSKATLALAKLYLLQNEVDQCQHQCVALMRIDPDNLDASMMLADLMMRKGEYDAAIYHFEQLLEKDPAHHLALHKLIVLLRHAGRLLEAEPFVKRAQTSNARASERVGLRFCAGLLARFLNDPHKALEEFNHARKDSEWGEKAVQHMIEIYVDPDTLIDWSDETGEGTALNDDVHSDNIAAAERLLRELRPSKQQAVLECVVRVARKGKTTVEATISQLLQLLQEDQDYVPALVAVSMAHLVIHQTPKARNHLKRVSKMAYQAEYASDFELGWLLLAHVYIQGGKYDLAEELCRKCLAANKSCARAYELLGAVKEKELSYRDAATAYELAWQLEREAGATVGYKLAFNLLKAKEFVPAINVCHKVLKAYPDYPKIRDDILNPARTQLRA